MNNWIEPVNVVECVKSFLAINKGDEGAEDLIIAIGAELLDVSVDKFVEMIEVEELYASN